MKRMTQDHDTPEPVAAPVSAAPSTKAKRPASPPRGGTLALALLLSLVAMGGAGYVGWRQYTQETSVRGAMQDAASQEVRLANVERANEATDNDRTLLRQRLADAEQVNRSLRDELLAQADRTRNLEDAVAKLSERTLSGHDGMLLDETESLLRMAKERYALFHDAAGAAAAYDLADKTVAAVNDGAFSGLRQSINNEREALVKSQPTNQVGALESLTQLRATVVDLPLKSLDDDAQGAATDAWSRVRRALSSVVTVQRVSASPLSVTDARFARELVALDLAQAQAALLAFDNEAFVAALKRADANLAGAFDDKDEGVKQARARIEALTQQMQPKQPIELGAALTELRNLRSVHALKPVEAKP
ncbi:MULTISPECIES: uroporphyrinogen-III C-methyltransferase [Dyella]|nr:MULTISPECIES: uroporphyrinogen-III C-methyltransferase [Dyella]